MREPVSRTHALHRSVPARTDPPAGARVRLAAADPRLRARARAVPQAAQGAAARRSALRAEAPAAPGGRADRDRGGRLSRSRHHRRGAARAAPGRRTPSAASIPIRSSAPRTSATPLEFGVRTFVADNPDEVRKFARLRRARAPAAAGVVPQPRARCAICRASSAAIRRMCWSWRGWRPRWACDVQGLSFHVGSQAADPAKHVEAIEACTQAAWPRARREQLGTLDTLDIGGGFPIDYAQPVQDIGALLRADPRSAGEAARAHARHRRAGPLHRRPRRHRRRLRHGARAARGALVVLPGRRTVRLLQRPAVRSRALSGRAAARCAGARCPRCWRDPPATASM